MSLAKRFRIAAIVPCHNEEAAVGKVVSDLRVSVPGMTVYVYDNCSTDRTVERALAAGAVVCSEPLKGKGNVVRRAFADIDADIYLLIDGDDTYDAAAAPAMIEALVEQNLDHVVGLRRELGGRNQSAFRPAHTTGNRALNRIVTVIFGDSMGDMLSGYRVFSRRFVKSFPALSQGFEIETELTVHSLALRIPSTPFPVDFRDRAEGSQSKLRTYRDGWRILNTIMSLTRHERPMYFFGTIAAMYVLLGLGLAASELVDYIETSAVPHRSSVYASAFLLLMSVLGVMAGLVLDGIRRSRQASSRLSYMRHPAVRDAYVRHQGPSIRLDSIPADLDQPVVPVPRRPGAGTVAPT